MAFIFLHGFKTSNEQYFVKMEKLHEIQMSVSIKLYWNTAATICLYIIYDFFYAQIAQLRSVAKAVCGTLIALCHHSMCSKSQRWL